MKRKISWLVLIAFCCSSLAFSTSYAASKKMKVTCSGVKNGAFKKKYGYLNGNVSIPISIKNAPKKAVAYAIILDDPDAIPIIGKVFTHWLVANLTKKTLAENAAKKSKGFIQGKNDFDTVGYGGMAPPDRAHRYNVKVYALKKKLSLKKGFTRSKLLSAMKGKILSSYTLKAKYTYVA